MDKKCAKEKQHHVRVLLLDLLSCCDFQHPIGIVNFNFTEALEDTLTEQERSILTLHY